MAAPHAVDAAGDSGKGQRFIANDTAGRSESFSSLLYMPPSIRSKFMDVSADTDKRKEHDSEPQDQGKRAKLVLRSAGMQEAQLERHSADGGAASLVGQSVDAANAAVTLATMRAGLDPQFSGFDGATEFRAFTESELLSAIETIEDYILNAGSIGQFE
jgi:hypothetical protein